MLAFSHPQETRGSRWGFCSSSQLMTGDEGAGEPEGPGRRLGWGQGWGAPEQELSAPGVTPPPRRGFALYNAANLKSIDLHRKAEEKSLAQLKRQ